MNAAELLVMAYEKGQADGGSIDWSDLDEAYAKAVEELPAERVKEIRLAAGLDENGEVPDGDEEGEECGACGCLHDDEKKPRIFINHYECPECSHTWEDRWCAQSDDDCPNCGKRHISPHKSEDAE